MPDKYVLIVEDEDSIRLTLRDYLKKKGFNVLVASDGVGAIKHLLDNKVDLIVSDYRMNTLGGNYWVKFLEKYCSDIRIFITSGFLRPEFDIPFEVLYKPFDYAELAEKIERLFRGMSDKLAFEAVVHGRVQGVGFRYSTCREASRQGVTGWVRNEYDGTVRVYAEGDPLRVKDFLRWLKHGPPGSDVTSLDYRERPYKGIFKGFSVDY